MRWVFLFLMLANAILLFWYATTQPSETVTEAQRAELNLKLVSEMPSEQLLPRVDPVRRGLAALAPAPTVACYVIGATEDLLTAQRIMNFFSERGQTALINQTAQAQVVGYELVFTAPDGDAARLQLLNALEAQGVIPESRMENGRLTFVAGVVKTAKDAFAKKNVFGVFADNADIRPLETKNWSYFVQINGPFDQEMSNKISGIVKKAYPAIKIEKKLCKGVASPRGGH